MHEPLNQISPTAIRQAGQSQIEASGGATGYPKMLLRRPVGVIAIAVIDLIAGGLLFLSVLEIVSSIYGLYNRANVPENNGDGDLVLVFGGLICFELPFMLLFIVSGVGLLTLRKWGLGLGLANSAAVFLAGVFWLSSLVDFGLPFLPGILLLLLGPAMFIYLVQRKIRAQFR